MFRYIKIKASLIPEGWSNEPRKLKIISDNFLYESFGLGSVEPILVSTIDGKDPRYLLRRGNRFYLWHAASEELFYITKFYTLQGILRRIKGLVVELPMKDLPRSPSKCLNPSENYIKLSPNQIPQRWSNDPNRFSDLHQMMVPQKFGLQLPLIMILYCNYPDNYTLFQSGHNYYLYEPIIGEVLQIEEPLGLEEILRELQQSFWYLHLHAMGKLKRLHQLSEYGGPIIIPDYDVPHGWTNIPNASWLADPIWSRGWKLSSLTPSILLFSETYLGGPPAYIFESVGSLRSSFYLLVALHGEIYRIDDTEGLPEILLILADPSRKLTLTPLCSLPGTESYMVTDDEMPAGWERVKGPDVCSSMPWEKHALMRPTPILQRTYPNGDAAEYLVESGLNYYNYQPNFYIWNPNSGEIHRVKAGMFLHEIFSALDDPLEELPVKKVSPKKAAS